MGHAKDKQDTGGNIEAKDKNKGPLMILTSGKIVGNVGEQWKGVRDSRLKNTGKQDEVQPKTGKEIIPVNEEASQRVQSVKPNTGKELIPGNKGGVEQVQVSNKYAVLEVEEGERDTGYELVIVEKVIVDRSPRHSPKNTGRLDPSAAVFKPKNVGIEVSKETVATNIRRNGTAGHILKETTAQWVKRAFGGNLVNQSYMETPSQTMDCQELTCNPKSSENEASKRNYK